MRKLSRKLVIACLAVAFAVIALGTSTYAWLVVSKTASVDSITADVKAGDGSIEVSKTGVDGTWKSSISSSDLTSELSNFEYDNVTYDGSSFKKINIDLNDGAKLTAVSNNKGILEFSFYIKLSQDSGEDSETLKLDLANCKLETIGSTTWTPDKPVKIDDTNTISAEISDFKVSNAARVMVKYETTKVILENDVHPGLQANTEDTGAMGYLKSKTGLTSTQIAAPGTYSTTKLSSASYETLGEVTKNPTEVTVTIWIEGYDFDCINALYKQRLSVTLGFSID